MPTYTEYFVHAWPAPHQDNEGWNMDKAMAEAQARLFVRSGAAGALVERARVERRLGAAPHTDVVRNRKLVFGVWRDDRGSRQETTNETLLGSLKAMTSRPRRGEQPYRG